MAKTFRHHGVRIVTLLHDESIAAYCHPDDIAIVKDEAGWWTCFVGEEGAVDKYDIAFDTWEQAFNTAKAAAEYAME